MSPWDSFALSFSPSISSFIPEMAAVLDTLEDTPGNAGLLRLSLIQRLFHQENKERKQGWEQTKTPR